MNNEHNGSSDVEAVDFLDLNTTLEQTPVEEHLPIYEGLINDLKVNLDF